MVRDYGTTVIFDFEWTPRTCSNCDAFTSALVATNRVYNGRDSPHDRAAPALRCHHEHPRIPAPARREAARRVLVRVSLRGPRPISAFDRGVSFGLQLGTAVSGPTAAAQYQ